MLAGLVPPAAVGRSERDGMGAIENAVTMACGDCAPAHPLPEHHALVVTLLIVAFAVIGGVIIAWQLRRKRHPPRVTDQWSALAVMGELCPRGWTAEIGLHGRGVPLPADAPFSDAQPVAVRWKLYDEDGEREAVARWVTADTIEEALQKMVEDRRLDIALEQIEQSAAGEGDRI
jgi:hypothetical protein